MISVLIPVFNFDARQLIRDIDQQLEWLDSTGEILVFDDGSTTEFKRINQEISDLPRVKYREMPANLGRSIIRNKLAEASKYSYLLFLDCDSSIIRDDFLRKYLSHADSNRVIVGGRRYPSRPEDPLKILHWKYGTKREHISESAFQSNNFLISRTVFSAIRFDEKITTYGHEDTLFGHRLNQSSFQIKHIDNPVMHLGLQDCHQFLKLQETAIDNLLLLTGHRSKLDTRLLQVCERLDLFRLSGFVRWIFTRLKMWSIRHLCGQNPTLWVLDFYKIGYLLTRREAAKNEQRLP